MFLNHFLIPEVNETNVYLIGCRKTGEAALIDAGGFKDRVAETVKRENLKVTHILITHDHFDHTDALAAYQKAFPESFLLAGSPSAGGQKARSLTDGETFQVGTLTVRALAIHGHTPDSTAFHFFREAAPESSESLTSSLGVSLLFSGDILFSGSVGGTAGGAAHEEEIQGIREKIFTLPDATPIYPGHGPASSVGIERHHNPFF